MPRPRAAPPTDPFGAWLTQWLLDHPEVTHAALAADIGVSKGLISQWAAGGQKPKPENLRRLARRTGQLVPVLERLAYGADNAQSDDPFLDAVEERFRRVTREETPGWASQLLERLGRIEELLRGPTSAPVVGSRDGTDDEQRIRDRTARRAAVLRLAREGRGLSVGQVAVKLGVNSHTVQLWESGESEPSLRQFHRLAILFEVPLSTLTDPPPTDEEFLEVTGIPRVAKEEVPARRRARRSA